MAPVRLLLLFLLVGVGAVAAHAQPAAQEIPTAVPDTVVERVSSGFTNGDAQRLLTPAAERVEVSIFGARTFYSNAQAFYVLREFFDTHPPVRFALTDVTEAEESCFLRGTFDHTRDERTLEVYVHLARRDGEWKLKEVRIDEHSE